MWALALSVDQKLEPWLSIVEKRLQPSNPWNRCGTTLTFPSLRLAQSRRLKHSEKSTGVPNL